MTHHTPSQELDASNPIFAARGFFFALLFTSPIYGALIIAAIKHLN